VPRGSLAGMRPAIRPGLLPVWRDHDTVQIGIDPRRACALTGMRGAAEVITLLDGSRDRELAIADAARLGVPRAVAEQVMTVLAAAGVLIDYPAELLRSVPPELRQGLTPVLAVASLSGQDSDGGARVLARRSAVTVTVRGRGPVAAMVADLLTRSGLAALAEPPAGLGRDRQAVPADLMVVVGRQSPAQASDLLQLRLPHLAVAAAEAIGVVGPLVLPGSTACLRCLDLARADRDPAWPLVLAQAAGREADPPGCDPVLATAVAAQAAAQVVAFADQAPVAPATVNGTLELTLPAWQWRRRSWLPHPACCCGSRPAA
jgi:bacteriocin biosynthesis cyclodehydratase domain-containing protein